MKKPLKLKKGDTIGIIAPASGIKDKSRLLEGISLIESMGYRAVPAKSCFEKNGFLSGDDLQRLYDINTFFSDPLINAVFSLRGGYGSIRILDKIDCRNIKENPKIFLGYSDITAIHFLIHKKCNLVTFHGPMVASDIADNDEFTIKSMLACLEGRIQESSFGLSPLMPGDCSGKIFGGNLSMICSLLGTKYDINWNNKVLFIEDVDESPYSIDRMLHHLRLSGIFEKVCGVVLGQFTDCIGEPCSQSVEDVLYEFFENFKIPVFEGFNAGHGKSKITFPLGADIEVKDSVLKFKMEGVS